MADPPPKRLDPVTPSFGQSVGRDIRFRDAENLFRTLTPVEAGFAEPEPAPILPSALAEPVPQTPDLAARRILPDLVAEAALSEATLVAAPAPKRRGRPPKVRGDDAVPESPKSRRKVHEQAIEEADTAFEMPEPAPVAVPAVLYLAASARRRAARATDNLPRAQRWKRRLPKVCW